MVAGHPFGTSRRTRCTSSVTCMTESDSVGTAALEKLATELDGQTYVAQLVTPQGRRPYLHVRNRAAGVLTENVYAGDGVSWWGWAQRSRPVSQGGAAGGAVARSL